MPKTKDAMNLPKRKFKIMNLVWTIIHGRWLVHFN